jgi:hypothetical protein
MTRLELITSDEYLQETVNTIILSRPTRENRKEMVEFLLKFRDELTGKKEHTWTDGDIDAAYLAGAINASAIPIPEGEPWPSLTASIKEIERLQACGFSHPHKAIKALRYPNK